MKRANVKNVLVIGSGPIVIGQACEFDYSGTQACKALKEEGIRVVLINSNPATIMTDPSIADRTYIETINAQTIQRILQIEKCDSILPTMGGQTGINVVLALSKISHALDGIELIGANLTSINLAEDRLKFGSLVTELGMDKCKSKLITTVEEVKDFAKEVGYPFLLRPSYTLGGTGQSFVYSPKELEEKSLTAIKESPIGEVLLDESIIGWKEYELEVVRDSQDNAIVICSIENVDPMGVHTGDSITVAPQQTLTDREYQDMRSDALKIVRAVGVETGGCNVQFAVNPTNGRRVVIEMNPRVSRSSALASKVTGYPIAYISTKLALGYYIHEIKNMITGTTQACFEPPIDYVAVKIPRWNFEKFSGVVDQLLPKMQSVGETLALGGSFGEAFHKSLLSLEKKWPMLPQNFNLKIANSNRPFHIWDALASGISVEKIAADCGWDIWFLNEIKNYQLENKLTVTATNFPNQSPRYEVVDTCAGENKVKTSYCYSTRENFSGEYVSESANQEKKYKGKVVILGSGPNRIGQGVEFDYCCVHSSLALQRLGYQTIMVNCNPETVSTDPSVSDKLYLEPITSESIKAILEQEFKKSDLLNCYVLLQMGGQTPLKLSGKISQWGYKTLGMSKDVIDLCEDREKFSIFLDSINIKYPSSILVADKQELEKKINNIELPVLVRPSYVLGGRAMKIVADKKELREAFSYAFEVSENHPVYIDRFHSSGIEYDVDGISDGKKAWIAGVMEHVEQAGIHSGDSSCVIPPFRLPVKMIEKMAEIAKKIVVNAGVVGFFNIQMLVEDGVIYIIEANPRASRTVPFLAKATGYPLVEWAIRASLGESIHEIVKEKNIPGDYRLPSHGYAVKAPVLPFDKFPQVDPVLSPEMKSTGEVMGIDKNVGAAFAKALLASSHKLPVGGSILISVKDDDKPKILSSARIFKLLGFELFATSGTYEYLHRAGVGVKSVAKIGDVKNENVISLIQNKTVSMVINTVSGVQSIGDGKLIRKAAIKFKIPLVTTISGAEIASLAIQELKEKGLSPVALQDFV